jgi:membrane associated rhomboid family serine protease
MGSFLFYNASLGASGAVMGIMGALGVLRPKMTVYVSYIPMPMSVAVIVWALGDLFGFFNPFTNVAHIAHLAGLATGIIFGLRLKNKYGRRYERKLNYFHIGENKFRKWEDGWM